MPSAATSLFRRISRTQFDSFVICFCAWNIFALLFLINIVVNAILSIPSPLQKFAFDLTNIAVLHFPFIWLPAVVMPIFLFSHLASLSQLLRSDKIKTL